MKPHCTRADVLRGPAETVDPVRSSPTGPASFRSVLLLLGCGALAGCQMTAPDHPDAYRINVRSTVEHPYTLFSKKPLAEHGKVYVLAGIQESSKTWKDASNPLVAPVNEDAMLKQLRKVLADRGYREAQSLEIPDIVITVFYGRAHTLNPYLDKTIEVEGAEYGLYGLPVVSASADQIQREKATPGYYEKMQRANGEKLFISINAWEFPGFVPKQKPRLLWRTTVTVDDSDQDLNRIAAKMVAASGNYFDQETENEEVTVLSNEKEGQVQIGTTVEVDPKGGK